MVDTFNEYGCIIVPRVLDKDDCNEIKKLISIERSQKTFELGDINSNYKRIDLVLPLKKYEIFIKKIYKKLSFFCDKLIPRAKIVECASLISYPGCYPQIWHSDTDYISDNDGNLISFGIALSDVTDDMGPLEVYLSSNKIHNIPEENFQKKYSLSDDSIGDNDIDILDGTKYQVTNEICKKMGFQHVKCACNIGDLVIWSSKVIHRGGANTKRERAIFYFSLLGEGNIPEGATYSLKDVDKDTWIKDIC
tara:strand:+ start:18031 stop:18780 length:750 start_codon:yes stop_codon:yes gene_type:complete